MGRQQSWPDGRYSTIAGFVEPGESLEDSVRREVYEETNIRVGEVSYHSSQPWPFPSSLMLGFIAEASSSDIALNDGCSATACGSDAWQLPCTPTGAKATPLATEGDQFFIVTGFAPNPEKAMLKPGALQVRIEFLCDVGR